MLQLEESTLPLLKKSKNLLAFSAGVDSSALFFLLLEYDISFDIALVNYKLRKEADEEALHAIRLAKKYNLQVYTIEAPSFKSNFEKNARDFRYTFFNKLIQEHGYKTLITAHQLNDQLEWFLMRLTKGAGTNELLGLAPISKKQTHTLLRPLLQHAKEDLLNYLKIYNYPYFIDLSNQDEKYERNHFRKEFSDKLIENYKKGIQRSFNYLREDKNYISENFHELFHEKEFYLLKIDTPKVIVRTIDQYLKKLGYLLSAAQRASLNESTSMVIGGLWAIEIVQTKIFIAPYKQSVMPKKFKESCRVLKIPSKVRSYLYEESIDIKALSLSF